MMENKAWKGATEESEIENLLSREEKLRERNAVLEDELLDLRSGRDLIISFLGISWLLDDKNYLPQFCKNDVFVEIFEKSLAQLFIYQITFRVLVLIFFSLYMIYYLPNFSFLELEKHKLQKQDVEYQDYIEPTELRERFILDNPATCILNYEF